MLAMTPLRLLALLLLADVAMAQEPTGSITGSVTDPSGATVPLAKVTVEDVRTTRTVSAQTSDTGEFTFPSLRAGVYSLKIEAQGFAAYELEGIAVEIDRTTRVAAGLSITGKQHVEVSATAPTVETGATSLGQTVSQQQIVDLPLNGRNFTQLGLLQ